MSAKTHASKPHASEASPEFDRLTQNEMGPATAEQHVPLQHVPGDVRWGGARPQASGGKGGKRRKRSWYPAVIACIVLLVVLGIVGAGVTYSLELWGGKTVPSLVGLTSSSASSRLSEKGLAVQINYVPSDNGNDRVISADPGAGTRVADGSTITLTVGQSRVLPAVVGKSATEAREVLNDAGATNVRLVYQQSTEKEGTVLSVNPSEGSTFVSNDQVTLTIAQLPKVPDVVGRTVTDALTVLSDAGLTPTMEFVRSGKHPQGYVEATSPSAGRSSDENGSVRVTVVGSAPANEYDVAGYLSSLPQALSDFFSKNRYTLSAGYTDDAGYAVERLEGANGNSVVLSTTPWTRSVSQPSTSEASDVLESATSLEGLGVSVGIAASQCPQGAPNAETCAQVMQLCGMGGQALDTCDKGSARLPQGTTPPSGDFYSAYGEQGDYGWSVVLYADGAGSTNAIATYAPKASFDALDLSQTGNSKASYLAWATLMS